MLQNLQELEFAGGAHVDSCGSVTLPCLRKLACSGFGCGIFDVCMPLLEQLHVKSVNLTEDLPKYAPLFPEGLLQLDTDQGSLVRW